MTKEFQETHQSVTIGSKMILFLMPLSATLTHTTVLVEAKTTSNVLAANILELSIKNLVIFVCSIL